MPGRAPRVFKSDAIVLRHRRLGEADRIVTLLVPSRGRVDAVAKGALRPRSKLAGHLEPLTHVDVVLAHGRSMDVITQAETIEAFPAVRDDLERLSAALYLLELTMRLTHEHHEAAHAYAVLHAALLRLERGDGVHLATRTGEMALLETSGFRPEWARCIACGEAVIAEGTVAWSASGGGVLCAGCRGQFADAAPIDGVVLRVLRALQAGPYEAAAHIRLAPPVATAAERVMHALVEAVTEHALGSARFVASARRANALAHAYTAATAREDSAAPDGGYTGEDEGE